MKKETVFLGLMTLVFSGVQAMSEDDFLRAFSLEERVSPPATRAPKKSWEQQRLEETQKRQKKIEQKMAELGLAKRTSARMKKTVSKKSRGRKEQETMNESLVAQTIVATALVEQLRLAQEAVGVLGEVNLKVQQDKEDSKSRKQPKIKLSRPENKKQQRFHRSDRSAHQRK